MEEQISFEKIQKALHDVGDVLDKHKLTSHEMVYLLADLQGVSLVDHVHGIVQMMGLDTMYERPDDKN